MTLTAEVVADLHAADGALADLDADSDVGFFSMSPASAEQVTVQIDVLGAAGVRSNRSLMRIVRAAVDGRPARTGRALKAAS